MRRSTDLPRGSVPRARCCGAGARVRGGGARARIDGARPDESAVQRSGAPTASPDRQRRLAHAGPGGTLAAWIKTAARLLRPGGTLTLIWRADGLADVLRALDAAFGGVTVLPVHSKAGAAGDRILVRAAKASRAPLALLPGLILADDGRGPTAQAELVLRAGAILPLT